ncbi:hypothetical protein NTGZN8_130187 [Candidatus Nitrotoga fabula]|uniref:Uncharacterized protein n=1 Tax=Candidatus Nitrotoga fabula TaxID=2182327 RepID=A0A916BCD2_9PROT|nr:hypothetical protein NTGZN8_130187 [Candidatus Nitrotoga fabula]
MILSILARNAAMVCLVEIHDPILFRHCTKFKRSREISALDSLFGQGTTRICIF